LKKTILGLLLSSVCFGAFSNTLECVILENNNTLAVGLKPTNEFANCFSLSSLPSNTNVQFFVYSTSKVKNKITLFEVNESGVATTLSEHFSNNNGGNVPLIDTSTKKVSFSISPMSHLVTPKNTRITFLTINGDAQVLIKIEDRITE
jgi:hypothetical protein